MNISTLQPAPPSQAIASSSRADEKDADFLSLRLLNKRIRVRLSPDPLDLSSLVGKGTFLAIATSKGWFAAVTRNSGINQIIFSPLHDLRLAIVSSTADDGEIPFAPRRTLSLSPSNVTPTHITFALRDERLVVGLAEGAILMYDTRQLLSQGNEDVEPLKTLAPTSTGAIRQVLANPEDIPELVAVRRDVDGSTDAPAVEILNVNQLEVVGGWRSGGTPGTTPTSMSWSPKGKQLALGLQSGEIVTFAPSTPSAPKSLIPAPTGNDTFATISLTWLSNPAFLAVYAPAGQLEDPHADQKHCVVMHDPKNTGGDSATEFPAPYFPSPGLRPPGAFCTVLKNWGNSRFIIFIGDGTSGDIGVLGCLADQQRESWHNFMLEETSTPSLPLDKNSDDTILLGLDLDTTYAQTDDHEHPPPPVLLAYVSDGTIQAWYVSQTDAGAYGGMHLVAPQTTSTAAPTATAASTPAEPVKPPSSFGTTGFGFGSQPGPFGQSPQTSAFGQTAQPTQAQSPFGQTAQTSQPVFGQSSFGQPTAGSTSAFGQPSGFGQSATTQPTFGQTSVPSFGQPSMPAPSALGSGGGGGFGSFASQGPTKFGSTGFGFTATGTSPTSPPAATSTPPPRAQLSPSPPQDAEAEMSDAADDGAMGGLSLGGLGGLGSGTSSGSATATNSMFGSFGTTPTETPAQTTSPSSGSSSFVKPATGFGAFASQTSSSPFVAASSSGVVKPASGFGAFAGLGSSPSAFGDTASASSNVSASENKPSPAFGSSGFGTKPVFGQSTFGQPAFGQPSFGQSASGKPSFPSPASTTSAFSGSGGFAAFASSGTGGFGSALKTESSPPPAAVKSEPQDTPTVKVEDTGGGVFGQAGTPSTSAFGSDTITKTEAKEPSVFGDKPIKTEPTTPPSLAPPPMMPKSSSAMSISESISAGRMAKTPESSPEGSPTGTERRLDRIDELTRMSPEAEDTTWSPTQTQAQVTSTITPSPFGKSSVASTTPASSPFKSTTAPSPGFGAFSNLKSTPSVFGSTTFGSGTSAFGASTFASSVFANPKPPIVSAFGQGGATATSPAPSSPSISTTPKFGAPSQLGSSVFGKSSLGTTTPVSAFSSTPSKPPITAASGSAFGAYVSGGFSGFASAGSKQSSFKDLLKKEKDEPAKPEAAATPADKAPKGKDDAAVAEEATSQPKSLKDLSGESSYIEVPSTTIEELDEENLPPTPSTHGTFDEEEEEARRNESGEIVVHDDTASFLSDSYSESEELLGEGDEEDAEGEEYEEDVEEEEEDQEEEEVVIQPAPAKEASPASVPLPASPTTQDKTPRPSPTPPPLSRGPSIDKDTTPKPKSASPPGTTEVQTKTPCESTTPPGSPDKETSPPTSSVFAPKTSPTASGSSSSSSPSPSPVLGLGRPASRPIRSSPLANAPVISEPTKHAPAVSQGPPVVKPRPASPRLPFGQMPPSFKVEPTAPVPTKAPETPTFKFGMPPSSSIFSQPQQGTTPVKSPPTAGSTSPTKSSSPVFLQPAPTPMKTPPAAVVSPSPSSSVFSSFKYPATPTQPPTMSAAAQSLTSPSAPFIFPGASPIQTQLPSTPAQPSAGAFGTRFAPPGGWGTPGHAVPHMTSPQSPHTPPFQPQVPARMAPQVQMHFDSELQKSCHELYTHMCNELAELQRFAQAASQMRERRQSSMVTPPISQGGGPETPARPNVNFEAFKKSTKQLMDGINESLDYSKSLAAGIRELESNMLKAETRKEEILRFSRAKEDPEFAKMLKVRTLGPEATETQGQLRRQIRAITDRVEQLESHLRACKKKLDEHHRGKPSFKAPSLDTISRTYRNIDIAIEHQTAQISALTERVSRLKLLEEDNYRYTPRRSLGARNGSFNDIDATPSSKRGCEDQKDNVREVTPSVAASTAAALNAERSAQRLKNALSQIRKEPVVNRQAIESNATAPTLESLRTRHARRTDASNANTSSTTYPSHTANNTVINSTPPPNLPSTPLRLSSASLFGSDPGPLTLTPSPPFGRGHSSPDASSTPLSSGSGARRNALPHAHDRPGRQAAHARPVPLKRAASATPLDEEETRGGGGGVNSVSGNTAGGTLGASSGFGFGAGKATTTFDWGPLPKAAPRAQISSDVRPEAGKR